MFEPYPTNFAALVPCADGIVMGLGAGSLNYFCNRIRELYTFFLWLPPFLFVPL